MGFTRTALANVEPIHDGEEAQKPVHQGGKLPIRLIACGTVGFLGTVSRSEAKRGTSQGTKQFSSEWQHVTYL